MERPQVFLADTCFFIDLERLKIDAIRWLVDHEGVELCASTVTYGELAVGITDREVLDEKLTGIEFLEIDSEIAWNYGDISRVLRRTGALIGANDLWIAATALSYKIPILSRNIREFSRVPGLIVSGY